MTLKSYTSFLILPHTMPDGDTIGSSVALFLGLKSLGKDAYIVLDDAIPEEIQFVAKDYILSQDQFQALNATIDCVVTVDMSDIERLRDRKTLIDKKHVVNIDHHKTNSYFGSEHLIDIEASATGEIIYTVLKAMHVDMTPEMADALYVAINTDTGSFKYQNTTPTTLRIAADLLDLGARTSIIMKNLYHNVSRSKIKLHAQCMQDLTYFHDGRLALCLVSQDQVKSCDATMLETDGLVEAIRDIRGVDVVILIKEYGPQESKVSMRSIGDCDVATLAHERGGGGHKNAAGFTLTMPLEAAKHIIESDLVPRIQL